MSYALSELERMLANLIRVGVVTALDETNALVKVKVGGMSSDWLPWITGRAGATRTWSAPRPGEQVLVLSPYGDTAQGIVLPAIYQDDHPAPAATKDIERVVFPDGSVVEHNSASNTLTVTVAGAGNVIVNCQAATVNTDTASIVASTSVMIDTPQTTCTGALTVQGPFDYHAGMSGTGAVTALGTFSFNGDAEFLGALTNKGRDVGFLHAHSGVQPGGGVSGPPVV